MENKRQQGYAGELLVEKRYQHHGWRIIGSNYTIWGGEIDCIAENETTRCFIEVKIVNTLDDFSGYITHKKIRTLRRTLWRYNNESPTHKYIRIDVVFVKHNRIVQLFENVTL